MTVEARIADGRLDEHPFCRLELPAVEHRRSFLEGAAEFAAQGRLDSTYASFLGYDLPGLEHDFDGFVDGLRRLALPARVQQAGYRDRVLWLVDDGDYIGQASVRPELGTPYLITYGGHIGYSIRPSRRRRGYGRRILQLALLASALALFAAGARRYDFRQFMGLNQLKGRNDCAALTDDCSLDKDGVLGVIRHPWYTGGILIIWARPLDAAAILTNLVVSGYLVLGAFLEERKLMQRFGNAYDAYRRQVPMFLPLKWIRHRRRQ